MRISDIIFFGTIALELILIPTGLLFGFYQEWFRFWWAILLPIALFKAFAPESKFVIWLETKI